VVDVLHSRLVSDPDWGPQVTALGEFIVGRARSAADCAVRRIMNDLCEGLNAASRFEWASKLPRRLA